MNISATHEPIHRHPFAFSALVIAMAIAVEALTNVTSDLLGVELSVNATGIISGALVSLLGALVIRRLGLWRQLGLVGRSVRPRTLLWFVPFAIYGLLPLTQGLHISAATAVGAVAFGVLIASWKLMVLALVLYAWLPHGAGRAAALTASFWATMHLSGILLGASVAPTLVLCLSYVFLAFAFVAIRLRTGLLWPLVAAYALLLASAAATQHGDASNLAASVTDVMPAVAVSTLLAGYGLLAWPRRAQPATDQIHPRPTVAVRSTAGAAQHTTAR